jgi:hypothetical protein
VTPAELVWNRAALERGGLHPAAGDGALAALLLAHSLAMNGGVTHAVECLSGEELADAAAGFRYFGFNEVALLLEEIQRGALGDAETADIRYGEMVSEDRVLWERFLDMYSTSPGTFSPL